MCAHTHKHMCGSVRVSVCVCVSHLRWQLRRLLQMAALKSPGQEDNDDDDDDKRIKMEMKCQSSTTAALVFQPPPLPLPPVRVLQHPPVRYAIENEKIIVA